MGIRRLSDVSMVSSLRSPPPHVVRTTELVDDLIDNETGQRGIAKCGVSWLRLIFQGKCCSCETDTGNPTTVHFLCIHLTVLSSTHAKLLLSGFLNIPLILREGVWD